MNATEYQQASKRTLGSGFYINPAEASGLHAAMGVVTELGEIYEALSEKRLDLVNLKEEIGDVLWYLAIIERGNNVTFNENETFVDETGFQTFQGLVDDSMIHAARLLDLYKKKAFYNKDIIEKEEVFFGVRIFDNMCILADTLNISIEEIRATNIEKLKVRFPDKFEEEQAKNRNLTGERQVLEGIAEAEGISEHS